MRRAIQLCAVSALALVVASAAAAQQSGPGKNYVKELLLHLPKWVQNADGAWEGVQNPAVFAIKSMRGAYIYATYGEFSNFAISAQEIASTPPPQSMVEGWGLIRKEVETDVIESSFGLQGALMTAQGLGSGKDFISSKDSLAVAIWLDIPHVYREGERLKSGIASLFFRSPESIAQQGAIQVFFDLFERIKLQEPYASASIQDFLAWHDGEGATQQTLPSVAEPARETGDLLPPSTSPPGQNVSSRQRSTIVRRSASLYSKSSRFNFRPIPT